MNRNLLFLLFFLVTTSYADNQICTGRPAWPKDIYHCFQHIWNDGDNELYVTGYAWHNRYSYTSERIRTFNEQAWGGGFGKGLYDEKGNWHGLYGFVFSDSHKNPEPIIGYSYLQVAHIGQSVKVGGGYTLLVTARRDIFHGIPFPGVLPWASVIWHRATLSASYVPGAKGAGNVLFVVGKWTFDKQ